MLGCCYSHSSWQRLYQKPCNSISDSQRVPFTAPGSQQVPLSCLQWVWIRPVLLSCPNISTVVWYRLYSDKVEGTVLLLLQGTKQVLEGFGFFYLRGEIHLLYVLRYFSQQLNMLEEIRGSGFVSGTQVKPVPTDGDLGRWWTWYRCLTAGMLCETVTSWLAYAVLELGRFLLLYAVHTLFLPEWKYEAWESKAHLSISQ